MRVSVSDPYLGQLLSLSLLLAAACCCCCLLLLLAASVVSIDSRIVRNVRSGGLMCGRVCGEGIGVELVIEHGEVEMGSRGCAGLYLSSQLFWEWG